MRVLGIIPARQGSKRVRGKNMRMLGGLPLVERSLRVALACPSLTTVVVSSDDPEVLAVARRYPAVVALERPAELAADASLAIEYVMHALRRVEADMQHQGYDAVCIIQPSAPLTLASDVEQTIQMLRNGDASSAVSVSKLDQVLHPVKLKRLVGSRLLPYLEGERGRMAAHQLPELYSRNGAVYVTRRAAIDAGLIVTDDCDAHVMPRERSVDVNDEIDLALAELLWSRQNLAAPPR